MLGTPVNTVRIRRKHLFFVALITLVLFVAAYLGIRSAMEQNSTKPQNDIPSSTIEKSNQFIISRVGQDFFNKYITYAKGTYFLPDQYILEHPESGAEFLQRPYYLMEYSLKMPERPFVDELIQFAVDTNGNVISQDEVTGVPDLINNPAEGNFSIDQNQAVQIAKNAGLEVGIADWTASFHWYGGDLKTYVWAVQNTLQKGKDPLASGRVVVIDANSGEVLKISLWSVVT